MTAWGDVDGLRSRWAAQRDQLISAIKTGGVFSTAGASFCLPNGKWKLTAKASSLLKGKEELFDTFDDCLRRAVECTRATLLKAAEQQAQLRREARA